MASESSEARDRAERLFSEFMDRVDRGEKADFEALCAAESAEVERYLRRLVRARQDISQILGGASSTLSAVRRLRSGTAKDVDPGISLEPEDGAADDGSSSTLLERLAAHAPPQSRFRLKGEIGRGGMGAVFRAWDEDLRRHVALKVILGKAGAEGTGDTPEIDPALLGRFLEEAQVTGQLEHPGIVPVHELGLDAEGRVYFAMRLVKGETFAEVLEKVKTGEEGWSPTRALGILLRACEAVAFAHSKSVVHRDLKPENIMVGRFGEVYVMDWGLARVLGREDSRNLRFKGPLPSTFIHVTPDAREGTPGSPEVLLTQDGTVLGTPAYMPPEQAQGRVEEIGAPSDVYSMGAILYHLLTGQKPYLPPGARLRPREVAAMVAVGAPEPVAKLNPAASVELVSICEKAMAREMGARYPTMLDLARDLRAFLENRVVSAYESGPVAELKKWVKRNRAFSTAAMIAVLGIAGFGSWAVVARGVALANERQAIEEKQRVLRLSDVKTLADLKPRMDALWPAHPDKIEAMERWLEDARQVAERAPDHQATLAELRARGTPLLHPREPELAKLRAEGAGLAENESRVASLEAQIERERPYRFADATDAWWHDTLVSLLSSLAALQVDDRQGQTIRSVEERLAVARMIEQRSLEERQAWDRAIASIANRDECPKYNGLVIEKQAGLIPIGRDPDSGLWEFWHVQTGERPQRNEQGKLVLTEGMGIVLVLIPGGTFWMGAQDKDPQGRNYDPQANDKESDENRQPVEVTLDAYFLSKYEMTQGQWERFVGTNPSYFGEAGPGALLRPVEFVSWYDCERVLGQLGLVLPTEAQWEYGCRAGTDTPWWTGRLEADLEAAGNLGDETVQVGSMRANAFGLHDTVGNVKEWCRDSAGLYNTAAVQGDGERPVHGASHSGIRGGSLASPPALARSAYRREAALGYRHDALGCRPAVRVISW